MTDQDEKMEGLSSVRVGDVPLVVLSILSSVYRCSCSSSTLQSRALGIKKARSGSSWHHLQQHSARLQSTNQRFVQPLTAATAIVPVPVPYLDFISAFPNNTHSAPRPSPRRPSSRASNSLLHGPLFFGSLHQVFCLPLHYTVHSPPDICFIFSHPPRPRRHVRSIRLPRRPPSPRPP